MSSFYGYRLFVVCRNSVIPDLGIYYTHYHRVGYRDFLYYSPMNTVRLRTRTWVQHEMFMTYE